MSKDQPQEQQESTVRANQAPDAEQPGVSNAHQDYEQFRAETPEAQSPPASQQAEQAAQEAATE
jgi:hypothetical protein